MVDFKEEDIKIEVSKNLDYGYTVRAFIEDGDGRLIAHGFGYTYYSLLHEWFGIGQSQTDQLKTATCIAIQDLKDMVIRNNETRQTLNDLTKKAQCYAKQCVEKS